MRSGGAGRTQVNNKTVPHDGRRRDVKSTVRGAQSRELQDHHHGGEHREQHEEVAMQTATGTIAPRRRWKPPITNPPRADTISAVYFLWP